jgi:hypothetical protein
VVLDLLLAMLAFFISVSHRSNSRLPLPQDVLEYSHKLSNLPSGFDVVLAKEQGDSCVAMASSFLHLAMDSSISSQAIRQRETMKGPQRHPRSMKHVDGHDAVAHLGIAKAVKSASFILGMAMLMTSDIACIKLDRSTLKDCQF